jgi:hypothetical protein
VVFSLNTSSMFAGIPTALTPLRRFCMHTMDSAAAATAAKHAVDLLIDI